MTTTTAPPRQITPDMVVEAYTKTRDEIKVLTAQLDEKLAPLKKLQEARENWLMGEITRTGLKNLPTVYGTAYVTRAENVTCSDWDAFVDFLIFQPIRNALMPEGGDSGVLDGVMEKLKATLNLNLLDHKINKTAALEIMGEERQNPPPPGASYSAFQKIGVKKTA